MIWHRVNLLAIAAGCAASISAGGVAQKAAVEDVLEAAASYLVEYSQRLSVVAAEEEYTQYDTRVASATRRFHSDFVLVGLAEGELAGFRDVFSIDANPLRARDAGRLLKLLENPPTASVQQEATDITFGITSTRISADWTCRRCRSCTSAGRTRGSPRSRSTA
jgi:hypothetical protein